MKAKLFSIHQGASASEVTKIMVVKSVHQVMVNDRNKLVGIIFSLDLLEAL